MNKGFMTPMERAASLWAPAVGDMNLPLWMAVPV
jgi:hypothetical protein